MHGIEYMCMNDARYGTEHASKNARRIRVRTNMQTNNENHSESSTVCTVASKFTLPDSDDTLFPVRVGLKHVGRVAAVVGRTEPHVNCHVLVRRDILRVIRHDLMLHVDQSKFRNPTYPNLPVRVQYEYSYCKYSLKQIHSQSPVTGVQQ